MDEASKPLPRYAYSGLYVKSANGQRLRDRKVQRLARKLQIAMPWLQRSDTVALRAFCELEILSAACYMALVKKGITSVESEGGQRLVNNYRQLRNCQAVWARELGLTPAARMAISANGRSAPLELTETEADEIIAAAKPENAPDDASVAARGIPVESDD